MDKEKLPERNDTGKEVIQDPPLKKPHTHDLPKAGDALKTPTSAPAHADLDPKK